MRNKAKFIIPIFSLLAAVVLFFFMSATRSPKSARADFVGQNLRGWAWSDGIGWISFSSRNCDMDGNNLSDAPSPPCPASGTSIPSYGAHIDFATGQLFGHAWSEHIGWITFDKSEAGTPPDDNTNTYLANYNSGAGVIEGWARATSCPDTDCGADWGWIKMLSTAMPSYGVQLPSGSSDLTGWAWGDTVLSWISFNSKNCDTNNDGTWDACGLSGAAYPYKVWVTNNSPTAANLATDFSNRCGAPFNPTLKFDYSDSDGDALATSTVFVYDTSSALQGTQSVTYTTSVPSGTSVSILYNNGNLSYGGSYYFTVQITDARGAQAISGPSPIFKTDPHQRPQFVNSPKISWSPTAPFASSTVTLTASSTVYVSGQSVGLSADQPATLSNATYNWTITNATPTASALLNPQVFYASSTSSVVTVTVTDQSGDVCYDSNSSATTIPCACTAQSSLNVSKAKPVFREVKP